MVCDKRVYVGSVVVIRRHCKHDLIRVGSRICYTCFRESKVWRYLAQNIQDMTVLEAVQPPRGTWLPNNTLVMSRHGVINSKMAGGDVDGDLIQADVSTDD